MDKKYVYQDDWVKIRLDEIEENGKKSTYTVLERNDAVVIVPLSVSEKTLLLSEFRHPINSECWGFPMGFIDQGEAALQAAKRELSEEANLSGELIEIGMFYSSPGVTAQKVKVFICNVTDSEIESVHISESEENLKDIQIFDFKSLSAKVKAGEIIDGFTLSALEIANSYLYP